MSGETRGIVVRSEVQAGLKYEAYREDLRYDFWYACAYCTIAEAEAKGISFEVEHYEPVAARPDLEHEYDNLMYACCICNKRKGAWHVKGDMRESLLRVLRPDWDDPREHLALNRDRLVGRSSIGEFTVELLDLNRMALIMLRRQRDQLDATRRSALGGLAALRSISPDQLPREVRAKFLAVRKRLADEQDALDETLRSLNRSPLLDPDEGRTRRSRSRARYLQEVKSAVPQLESGRSSKGPKGSKLRRKKRR